MRVLFPMIAAAFAACAGAATAQPDLAVAAMPTLTRWTPTPGPDNIQAYSFAIATCNLGDAPASWNGSSPQHPVFAQNIHRIVDGRLEHLGLGFAFHGFSALEQNLCGGGCTPTGNLLMQGPLCSTPDTASILGSQGQLGPRSGVNPVTGALTFPIPPSACGGTPTAICERVQVAEGDLSDPDAIYIAETVLVQFQDAGAGMTGNNASWRRLSVNPATFGATMVGDTTIASAVQAWAALNDNGTPDPDVLVDEVVVPGDGIFHVGSSAKQIGNGRWRYTIAIENISSDRGLGQLAVWMGADPDPRGFTFHDADFHSGEVFGSEDWPLFLGDASFRWISPSPSNAGPVGSALRWGSTHTFSFTARAAPITGSVALFLFQTGDPQAVDGEARVPGFDITWCPGDVDDDGSVTFSDLNLLLDAYGDEGQDLPPDVDADGEVGFPDLNLLLDNYGQDC